MTVAEKIVTTDQFVHSRCFACGAANADGLGLVFSSNGDNRIIASCFVGEAYQGYSGVVQGGIIATILDSAMTNCLFTKGIEAMTVRLNVQYHAPVLVGEPLTVEARLVRQRGRLYELEASLTQSGSLKASADGRFMVPKDAV